MKKILLIICFSFAIIRSQAQLLIEPFAYTPDAVLGLSAQSGGLWSIINTGDSILLTAGSLTYPGLPASTGNKIAYDANGTDYYRDFTSQISGTVYRSFILNVSSLGSLGTTGGYFSGFIQSGSTSLFGSAVWTRLSTTAGKFNVGVSTRSNSAPSWLAPDLTPGTPVFIVAAYEMIAGAGNDVAKIWLNPALGGTEPAPDATSVVGTDITSVARVFCRQDNATNTPFIELDELRVGITWGDVTPNASVPTLSVTPLTAFGSVCINTTAGPNSFTITGSNLSTANVTVAALAGFTYSTTAGGTYTATLSLTQPGGAYSQQIFVRFTPTAVQSYNGNIVVGGGGAPNVNAAASGAGVNSMPTVTTGAASSIAMNSATCAGTINSTGCTAVTAYGIEYSTTNGFPNGTGTQVPSSNLAGGNFSSDLLGLAQGTTYYFKAYATNGGGTAYGTQQQFTTLTPNPTLLVTALTSFGNVCINTTAGPNSFTINGSNLTAANVTVAALAGYSYSTSAGGTYTATLSLTQPGGGYSQQIFVRFTPTAVQSYNGNIVLGGGGAPNVNVPAVGAGVNTAPSVTTGAASAITTTSATLAGSIPSTGCSAITAYGIEYSTTNGFANGTGTQVASSNLSGGSFSSNVSGLAAATTYYYKAYATNGGGTTYGLQQSFTTSQPVMTATSLPAFGGQCVNTTTGPNSFTITGVGLTTVNVNVGPLNGYTFSTTSGGTYTASLSITQPGGGFSQVVYVKFTPTVVQSYSANIPVSGGGALTIGVPAAGDGANTTATVVTGGTSDLNDHSVTLAGSISSIGCSAVTDYGIAISGINNFIGGNGVKYPSTNLNASNFTSGLNGLVQGATYYYRAYATNSGGTSYGVQQSFTVPSIKDGFTFSPVPAKTGQYVRITMKSITPGYYGLKFINSEGKLCYQYDMNIQSGFINQGFIIPRSLAPGIYHLQLVNNLVVLATRSITVF